MRRVVWVLAVVCAAGARAEVAPVLQWGRTTGGSGANQGMAAAADANGNLYIAGSPSSLDFPVASAVQPRAGGSTLFRIDRVSGQSEKLYPAGLSALASI